MPPLPPGPPNTPGKNSAFLMGGLIAAIMLIAVSKEIGMIDNATAKRSVSIAFGLLLILAGNLLPKLVTPLDNAPWGPASANAPWPQASSLTADRLAGFLLVLTGIAFTLFWVLAAPAAAMLYASMVGLAGCFLAAAIWTLHMLKGGAFDQSKHGARFSPKRVLILMLLHALFWGFAIFLADALWGDASAKWVALIFIIANGLIALPITVTALNRAQPNE